MASEQADYLVGSKAHLMPRGMWQLIVVIPVLAPALGEMLQQAQATRH